MDVIINVALMLLILLVLVLVHELGHFITAKRAGVQRPGAATATVVTEVVVGVLSWRALARAGERPSLGWWTWATSLLLFVASAGLSSLVAHSFGG